MRYEQRIWLAWAPLVAVALHICEEFVFPGGFVKWYKDYRPNIQRSITTRFLVIINGLLLILCYDAGAMRSSNWGVGVWLIVAGLLFANGVWHVVGAIKTGRYSPGILTGIVLYVPLAVYGLVQAVCFGHYPVLIAFTWFAVGASYQLWGTLIHKVRAQGQRN